MKDLSEIFSKIVIEGHGSNNLAKGLGLVLRVITSKDTDIKPKFRRRVINRLLALVRRNP